MGVRDSRAASLTGSRAASLGIYIHIPFCRKKCFYCDFPSYAGMESFYEAYKNALLNEIYGFLHDVETRPEFLQDVEIENMEISTIYIGGGTPTAFPPVYLSEILKALSKLKLSSDSEITVEANPGCLDSEMLSVLRQSGVNRLSIGLQAWQDRLLEKIGRIHRLEDFQRNYERAMSAGFENINVDLMFSLPGQDIADWRQSLENVASLRSAHISVYGLTVEENTPFGEQMRAGRLYPDLPGGSAGEEYFEAADRAMYEAAKEILIENGYLHYEISNFAKKGFYSRHNANYWKREPYIGFGLGAHSFLNGTRFYNTYDLDGYITAQGKRKDITEIDSFLTREDEMSETMFLGLRMLDGVCADDFLSCFGVDVFDVYGDAIGKLADQKLLEIEDGRIRLTSRGIDVSNYVFREFV